MDTFWINTAFELIDMRSFSNLWFWIALAVLWSSASHWVIGVPHDMLVRAKAGQVQACEDVLLLAGCHGRRITYIFDVSGIWIVGIGAFALTGLAVAGFQFKVEFAQALFLLGFPMSIVGLISVKTSRMVEGMALEPLLTRLKWHRMYVQMIGMVSIFVTSLWGMWTNMSVSALGG